MSVLGKSSSTPSFSIPSLPGNSINDTFMKTNFARKNAIKLVQGVRVEEPPQPKGSKFVKAPRGTNTYRQGSLPRSTSHAVFHAKSVPQADYVEVPAWEALEGHVLRFYAYGQDTVGETNLENRQLKKFKIQYYLVDDTLEVSCKDRDNSGMAIYASTGGQGGGLSSTYMKRTKITKQNGDAYSPADFQIGEDFKFLGRVVRIYDCDPFTAQYYEAIGMPLDMSKVEPDDKTDNFNNTIDTKVNGMNKSARPPRTTGKMYAECMMNGGHINRNMQQFMEKDRMVCRFYAVADDTLTMQYERRPFIFYYFLSDDTIQIIEQFPMNCGRAGFPTFSKRMRIPNTHGKSVVRGPMDSAWQEEDYYKLSDFKIGESYTIKAMTFTIYDVCGWTRKYFKNELGVAVPPALSVKLTEKPKPAGPTPPYTGLGTWDDSMGSVVQLIPKKPRKDMAKLFFNEGKILRFSAKFAGEVAEEDQLRRFLFNFYLQDDTLMVHEPPQRNTGIVTGRFLEKGVHLNELTGKLFHPDDFKLGSCIKVMCREFLLLDMDEYTRKYYKKLEDPSEEVGAGAHSNDLNVVLARLREGMKVQFPLERDIFRQFDADANGVLCYHEIERILQKFGFHLSPEETLVIMRYFDPEGTGQINYHDFCNTVFDPDWLDDAEREKQKRPLEVSADQLADYADKAAQRTVERAETEKIRRAVRFIGEVFNNRPNMSTRLASELEHLSPSSTYVSWELVRQAFQNIGHTFEPEDVQRCIKYLLPRCTLDRVPYFKLIEFLKSTFHDHSFSR